MRRKATLPALAAGLVLLAGCKDSLTTLIEPSTAPSLGAAPAAEQVEWALEAVSTRLARQIPGFGGFFYDHEGNLVAYLQDPTYQPAAKAALESILRSRPSARRSGHSVVRVYPEVIIRQGQYGFLQLRDWRDRMSDPVLDISGALFIDLDEKQNRIVVGVRNLSFRPEVESKLGELDIPGEAVVYTEASWTEVCDPDDPNCAEEPVNSSTTDTDYSFSLSSGTLRSFADHLEAGFRIQASGLGGCTLGYTANWNGYWSLVTASHCTPKLWERDGVTFYQPSTEYSNWDVGYEAFDYGGYSCGFFWTLTCRRSDTAVLYQTKRLRSFGTIARTEFHNYGGRNGGDGSINISSSNPRFQIVGETAPRDGDEVDKMGQTTGWTWGKITDACVHTKVTVNGKSSRYRCQIFATYASRGGDSGAPVFDWWSEGYGGRVRAVGTHVGSVTFSDGSTAAHASPISGIKSDLGGSLSVF
jgi:hypothetical protein